MQAQDCFGIALAAVVILAAHPARAATVRWAPGTPDPNSQFTLIPAEPREGDLITFFDPFDRLGWMSEDQPGRYYGVPRLTVNPTDRTIDLTLGPDRPFAWLPVVRPYTGLRGDFGRLSAGVWTYRSNETYTFTVAVPEPAGVTTLLAAAGAGLLVRRRGRA